MTTHEHNEPEHNEPEHNEPEHKEVVRESFTQQVGLFTGDD